MPSSKQRISVTITDTLQKTLDVLWNHYPHLTNSILESIQFLMIYGAEAIVRDRSILMSRTNPLHSPIEQAQDPASVETLEITQASQMSEDTKPNPDDDWA